MKKSLFCLCLAVVFWHGYAFSGYIDNNDGTITDTSTGLMWEKSAGLTAYTWAQAKAYCENLILGEQSDWRLPTRNELQSIVDYNSYNPSISTTFFPDTVASAYWSSTVNADGTSLAWLVDFYYGAVSHYYTPDNYYVRAVRAGQCGSLGPSTTTTTPGGTTTTTISGGEDNGTCLHIIPKKIHKVFGMIEPIKVIVLIADKNNVITVDDELGWCSDALRTMVRLSMGKRIVLAFVWFNAGAAEAGECDVMIGDCHGTIDIMAF
ncbi:MAG: DUF1566 domain-containing protein [Deltaproteobacteria bacterium]|nr:DUF1566 domain-containing protein [Deltaproteobacteria bacterium]